MKTIGKIDILTAREVPLFVQLKNLIKQLKVYEKLAHFLDPHIYYLLAEKNKHYRETVRSVFQFTTEQTYR